jgi:hypothetical protein
VCLLFRVDRLLTTFRTQENSPLGVIMEPFRQANVLRFSGHSMSSGFKHNPVVPKVGRGPEPVCVCVCVCVVRVRHASPTEAPANQGLAGPA